MGWSALILGAASLIAGQVGNSLPLPTPYKRHLAAAMLQFSLATLAAGCLAAWCVSFPGAVRWIPALSDRAARRLTGGAAVAYATGLAALSVVRHRALLTGSLGPRLLCAAYLAVGARISASKLGVA